ncbi:MAG TPA: sigma-70 family RNA polymerase sigma factor [Thermoanaerobaculia bacterium]|jgi:RNA polymerase sigma-70 factor (ECF subfamily)|nr:sigma-70 family RNA polymerase sigma factor [Thermoanaerobaculia bacterium]
METDHELIERVRGGDDDAFRLIVERHSRAIYRSAYRITGNGADADDVVQETFLRAYRALERFDARAAFTTWLHRIAINCSLDLIDSRKRRDGRVNDDEDLASIASTAASPDRIVHGLEMQRAVASAMERLSGNERTAFVLRHFEGMPLEEIGKVLGTQLNATKNTVFRAVKKLREQLQPFTGSLI